MVAAVQSVFRQYATFSGRASRSEYWWFFLFTSLGSLLLSFVTLLSSAFSLLVFLPSLAVFVRRLHDTDHSGWWWLMALIPLVGWIVLLVFILSKGDGEPNRFGPPATL